MTIMNEIGEIRLQFHLVTDSYDQLVQAIQDMLKSMVVLGQPMPKLVFTDNPASDEAFYLNQIPSVREQQQKFNELPPPSMITELSSECVIDMDNEVQKLSTVKHIDSHLTALYNAVIDLPVEKRVFALDAEWELEMDSRGQIRGSKRTALIQLGYRLDGPIQVVLIRTNKMNRLPEQLLNLFKQSKADNLKFVGKQVGGDLSKIGRDFKILATMNDVLREDLDSMALRRGKVTIHNNSLEKLAEVCLGFTMNKDPLIRQSDWGRRGDLTLEQMRYAALDAKVPLLVYEYLMKFHDRTARLSASEATPGLRVMVLPMFGSIVCMATPVGVGCILNDADWRTPKGTLIRPSNERRLVRMEKILSEASKVHLRGQNNLCLADFKNELVETGVVVISLPLRMLGQYDPSALPVLAHDADNDMHTEGQKFSAGLSPDDHTEVQQVSADDHSPLGASQQDQDAMTTETVINVGDHSGADAGFSVKQGPQFGQGHRTHHT